MGLGPLSSYPMSPSPFLIVCRAIFFTFNSLGLRRFSFAAHRSIQQLVHYFEHGNFPLRFGSRDRAHGPVYRAKTMATRVFLQWGRVQRDYDVDEEQREQSAAEEQNSEVSPFVVCCH